MNLIYNGALDKMSDFATGTFEWLLFNLTFIENKDHDFIADLTGEVSVASYARLPVTGATRTVNDTLDQIIYSCDDPDFGVLEDTESAKYLVLARIVTNDADSPLIYAFDLGGYGVVLGTTPTSNFIIRLHPDGFAVARQVNA